MPYITQEEREIIDNNLGPIVTPGQLNYAITKLCMTYLYGVNLDCTPTYQNYNEAIGVLESAKLELYRRDISKYEDYKLMINGDVIERKIN